MDNNPAAAAAVAAAWPGSTTLTRIRRRIALELVTIKDGPAGPHSALAARLSSSLRAKCPRLVEEAAALCRPQNGSLRCKQLLAHGPGFQCAERGLEDLTGGAFLYCSPYYSDTCVVLDLPALLKWHAGGSPVGPRTPPDSDGSSGGGGGSAAAARPGRVSGVYRSSGARKVVDNRRLSQYCHHRASYDAAAVSGVMANGGSYALAASGDAVAAATAEREGMAAPALPPLSFEELGLRAFPGPAAASQLRRLLVQRLGEAEPEGTDGLPPLTVPWRQLSPLVANSAAAAAQPSLVSPAAFRTFLQHTASADVFSAIRITRTAKANNSTTNINDNKNTNNSNHAASTTSHVDCVTMSLSALNQAAAAGLHAAIAAAWSGSAPVQKLKRAAAHVLSVLGSPDHVVNSGTIGTQLKRREPAAYVAARGSGLARGIMARLNEAPFGGFLLYDKMDSTEGCLRLRLNALLMKYPQNEGQDLGVMPLPLAAAADAVTVAAEIVTAAAAAQPPRYPATTISNSNVNGANTAAESATLQCLLQHEHQQQQRHMTATAPPAVATVATPATAAVAAGKASPGSAAASDTGPDQESAAVGALVAGEWSVNSVGKDPWVILPEVAGWRAGLPVPAPVPVPVPAGMGSPTSNRIGHHDDGSYEDVVGSDSNDGGGDEAGYRGGSVQQRPILDEPAVHWLCMAAEYDAMLQHCYSSGQAGLAVHKSGGRAEVAAVYVPAAATAGPGPAAATPYGAPLLSSWPACVYLLDCTALVPTDADAGGGDGADAAASLRSLLESPHVVKMAHGCEKVVSIAACCGARSIGPLLDTRVLLKALTAMLPPLPPPLLPAAGGGSGAMAALGPLAAAALSRLTTYVGGLREALSSTGLWSDRPELLGALMGRHFAALREETFGVREWVSNAAAHEAALVAAARHLPELWEALTNEAVPWVAMAAAATAVESALPAAAAGQRQSPSATATAGGGNAGVDPAAVAPVVAAHSQGVIFAASGAVAGASTPVLAPWFVS